MICMKPFSLILQKKQMKDIPTSFEQENTRLPAFYLEMKCLLLKSMHTWPGFIDISVTHCYSTFHNQTVQEIAIWSTTIWPSAHFVTFA